jgi:hypothetical protein
LGPDSISCINTVLEAPAVVSGFDDIAVMCEAIEESGRHFGVCKDAWSFAKGEIGGDDDRGALVKPADEVEQRYRPTTSNKGVKIGRRLTHGARAGTEDARNCPPDSLSLLD